MRRRSLALVLFAFTLASCGQPKEPGPAPDTGSELSPEERQLALGRMTFGECASCHRAGTDARHLVGPNLYGVVGAPAARHPDFAYSRAMQRSGIVWTPEALDGFLENPQKYLPGTRMSYRGLSDAERRAAVIAWLDSLDAQDGARAEGQ